MLQLSTRIGVCLIAFFAAVGVVSAAEGPEDSAQAAAEAWLKVVDGGDYPASWDLAASVLKGAVKQAEWNELVGGVRGPLGGLVSRSLKSREYAEKAPPTTRVIGGRVYTWGGNAPHVTLVFDAAFAKKAPAVETVVSVKDADGVWRVSWYTVR
jgi:hypothetical protein